MPETQAVSKLQELILNLIGETAGDPSGIGTPSVLDCGTGLLRVPDWLHKLVTDKGVSNANFRLLLDSIIGTG